MFGKISEFIEGNESIEGKLTHQEYYARKKKWFTKNFEIMENRLFVNHTKSYPCHIHFNGNSDILIEDLLKKNQWNRYKKIELR